MSRSRSGLATTAALAAVAAATTWVAMFSWRGFSQVPGEYLGPLLVLGFVVAATGTLARWSRWPVVAVVGFQLLVLGSGVQPVPQRVAGARRRRLDPAGRGVLGRVD